MFCVLFLKQFVISAQLLEDMNISDFCCGLLAGWTQVIVGQPFDFVKVKIQTAVKQLPISQITREIRNQFGLKGFYRGSSSLFFGFAFVIGSQFLVYEWTKKLFFKWSHQGPYQQQKLSLLQIATAGGIVGFSVSSIYCPVQYVKIQKQIHGEIKQSAIGLLFGQMRANGFSNIFKGYWSTVVRETLGSFFYYGSYEAFVRFFSNNRREDATFGNFLAAGGLAGITYHLVTYPIDTIKTNIQAGQKFTRALQMAIQPAKLRGYKVVLTRAALVNSSSFLVYEKAQQYLAAWSNFYYTA